METLEIEALRLGAKKLLTRSEIKNIIQLDQTIINDGGSGGTCHYNCVYDDALGNTHTYSYTGITCSSSADCTNSSPCSTLANGHEWVVSQTCS